MDALVDQFAAAGQLRIGPPFAVVTDAAALAVAGAEEHERSEFAAADDLHKLEARGMVAVVVAHADERAGGLRGFFDLLQFADADRGRLFHEDVFACAHGGQGQRRER